MKIYWKYVRTPNDMIGEVAQFIKDKSGFFYKVDAEDNGDGLFDVGIVVILKFCCDL